MAWGRTLMGSLSRLSNPVGHIPAFQATSAGLKPLMGPPVPSTASMHPVLGNHMYHLHACTCRLMSKRVLVGLPVVVSEVL